MRGSPSDEDSLATASGLLALARMSPSARLTLLNATPDPRSDPLTAVESLRREHPELGPDLSSAVIAQRSLRYEGIERGLLPADNAWLVTATGLEQASRPAVAARRAAWVAGTGTRSVVDATAGIGMDAAAFAAAGLRVVAVERDPTTAAVCAANLAALDSAGSTDVICADSTQPGLLAELAVELPPPVAVFVDPARRGPRRPSDGSRAHPERDPERWSPPWSFVESLRATFEIVLAKTPGSFTPDERWSCEWVGVAEYVAECSVFSTTPPGFLSPRQATLLAPIAGADPLTFPAPSAGALLDVPVSPPQGFLGEPHPVFHRSLSALCGLGAQRVHETSTWITTDQVETTRAIPGVRWYRVIDLAPVKDMKRCAIRHGVDAVAIKCKESKTPLNVLRKKVGLPDGDRHAVILTAGTTEAFLVERVLSERVS